MNQANIPLIVWYKIFRKAFKTAMVLDGLNITSIDGRVVTQYEPSFFGSNLKFVNQLCTWGEAGSVTIKTKATLKIVD
jgi:hypothetical protein